MTAVAATLLFLAPTAIASTDINPDVLSLEEAQSYAQAHRAEASIAEAAELEARALLRSAGAIANPVVNFGRQDSAPHRSLSIQEPIDWLLTRGPEKTIARAGVHRASAASTQVRAELGAVVRRAFFAALAARHTHELIASQVASSDSLVDMADRRLERGDISKVDNARVRLEATLAKQALSRAAEAEQTSLLALERAIGWREDRPLSLSGELTDGLEETAVPMPVLDALPSVRIARAESLIAAASERSARHARWPMPSFEVGAEWSDPSEPNRTFWFETASVALPIFDLGGANVAAARARSQMAAGRLREARLETQQELATARLRLDAATARAQTARDSLLSEATFLRRKAVRAFDLGETGMLPVIDALRSEREVVAGVLDDFLSYQEARASWEALAGTGP